MQPPAPLHFEDYYAGQRFRSAALTISDAAIAAFLEYDPQVFHRPETAGDTAFGRVIASGWQTAAYTMRLMVDAGVLPPGGGVGVSAERMRWARPVYPGDALYIVAEVEAVRSAPGQRNGFVRFRVRTRNQSDQEVFSMTTMAMVQRRPPPLA
jgi:acyl dehydratase